MYDSSSDSNNILSGITGVSTRTTAAAAITITTAVTTTATTTTTTNIYKNQVTDDDSNYDIINNSGINIIDSGIISKCDNIAAKLTTKNIKKSNFNNTTTSSNELLICNSDNQEEKQINNIDIGEYDITIDTDSTDRNGIEIDVNEIIEKNFDVVNVNVTENSLVVTSSSVGVDIGTTNTGTITLCHRFQTQSSTTSDLQQSTSATVDTVATSSGGLILNSRQGSVDGAMQRCGLCSILSRLLRRAMCVGSRRGSGESYYQELPETIKTFQSPEAQTIKTTDGAIYVCLMPSHQQKLGSIDTTERDDWRRRVSESDRPLLEALLDEEKHENAKRRHLSNGRFLTMHKRRRKKLTTRSLNQDSAILDDVLHGQVQCILNRVGDWRFNAFTLETVTGGRSLPVICVHLFHWYGLLDHFNLDVVRLWKLFTLIEEGYHSTNPYHNSIHATDVTQAMHCFLQERKIYENLKPIEILASLLGAVTHDLDHPGVNQPFLIATSNHLAALYENTSVLENHHWRSAVGCLLESGVAEQIQDIRPIVEKQIASLILATDITRQTEFLETFRKYLDTNTLDMTIPENRHFILQIALKCADISNPCRPWDISKKWSQKVCEEFFRQGDFERQLNLPVTSLCDRFTNSVPKIQVGFFKFVVTPLFIEWHKFLNTKLSTRMMKYLKDNEVQWSNRVAAEQAEETKTEISDDDFLDEDYIDDGDNNIENADNDNEDDIGEAADICLELSDSSEVLLPDIKLPRRSSLQVPKFGKSHFDRRHSVPVNPPKIILPPKEPREKLVSSCGSGTEHGQHTSTIREDFESKFDDSFSILSSDSENCFRKSSAGSFGERERPLSAETLLPELNIATMSKSDCADRLNIVMHGGFNSLSANMLTTNNVSKQLIRQQTFPPLQPYIRARYMSAGAEMTGCVVESSSSNSSQIGQSTEPLTYQDSKKKSKKDSFKREATLGNGSYQIEMKSHKMAKLSIPSQKENVDPSQVKLGQIKRRGSAPVDILCTTITATTTTITGSTSKSSETDQYNLIVRTCDKFIRRGSMPVDAIHIETTRDNESLLLNPSTFQRRGSIPFDHSSSVNRANNFNGKPRNRKKLLRRRSSGGAEILSPIMAEPDPESSTSSTSQAWYRFKRQKSDVESILNRRRGSLPVEVLAICHSGTLRH